MEVGGRKMKMVVTYIVAGVVKVASYFYVINVPQPFVKGKNLI